MKKLAFLFTGAAALALSACGDANDADDAAEDTTIVETETVEPAPAPAVTETTVVEDDTVDDVDVDAEIDTDDVDVKADVE